MKNFDLSDLNSMDGFEFEDLIAKLLTEMGYSIEQTKKTGDGGIDIIAHTFEPIISGKYIIQCKRQKSLVGEAVVRDLFGVISADKAANKGILITNSRFSSKATSYAHDKNIELIDESALINLIKKYLSDGDIEITQLFSPFQKRIIEKTVSMLDKREKQFNDILNGLIYSPKKHFNSIYEFNQYAIPDMQEALEISLVLGKNIDNMGNLLERSVDSIDNEEVKFNLKRLNDILNTLINKFKNASATTTDESLHDTRSSSCGLPFLSHTTTDEISYDIRSYRRRLELSLHTTTDEISHDIREIYIRYYIAILKSVFQWKDNIKDAMINPQKFAEGQTITLTCTIGGGELDEIFDAYKEESNRIIQAIESVESDSNADFCFIATACFGEKSKEVAFFRYIRDTFLLKHVIGKIFVYLYYKFSPFIAKAIKKNSVLKKTFRVLLHHLFIFCKRKLVSCHTLNDHTQ